MNSTHHSTLETTVLPPASPAAPLVEPVQELATDVHPEDDGDVADADSGGDDEDDDTDDVA